MSTVVYTEIAGVDVEIVGGEVGNAAGNFLLIIHNFVLLTIMPCGFNDVSH